MAQLNWPAVGFTVVPNVIGYAGTIITRKNMVWYGLLKKPKWTPPNWAFGPVWTALFSGMGYASYLVFRDGAGYNGAAKLPLLVYGTNLILNSLWTPIFFGAKEIRMAFYELQVVNVTALATTYMFYKVNPIAGYLLVPYCLWLGFATVLNDLFYRKNPPTKNTNTRITEIKDK